MSVATLQSQCSHTTGLQVQGLSLQDYRDLAEFASITLKPWFYNLQLALLIRSGMGLELQSEMSADPVLKLLVAPYGQVKYGLGLFLLVSTT